jgi:glycosyltransferase involved in cell wall biosynthesis
MRVGIDITALTARHTGVDRYLVNLVTHLALIPEDVRYHVFINREDRPLFRGKLPPNFVLWALCLRPRLFRLLFQQVLLPIAALLLRLDVVHSPSFIMPMVRGRARHLVTLHDLTTITMPGLHIPLRRSRLFSFAILRSIRKADLICVPSETVRREIDARLDGTGADKVRIVRYGVDGRFTPIAADRAILARLGVAFPYVLYVGTIEPRKNLARLVRAFLDLVERRGAPEHLVLAGPLGWDYDDVLELASAHGDRVHLPGFVPDDDLPALIAGARLFVYPSLGEGFGFPPLEAMKCGVPVVATRTSALTENLLGAAELVPADDDEALRDAMEKALHDDALRARLRARGLERAARFTWQATARAQLAAYRELFAQRRRSR